MLKLIIILVAMVIDHGAARSWARVGNPVLSEYPCNGTKDILVGYEPGKAPEDETEYMVFIYIPVPQTTRVRIKFDSEAIVTLRNRTAMSARISASDDVFYINFFAAAASIDFFVRGPPRGGIPYFKSIVINSEEFCPNPRKGFLDMYIAGYRYTAATKLKAPEGCGRRKVEHTELIVNGEGTKAGDWPWHAAIYKLQRSIIKYICGGTLVSKNMVLTAAHCATEKGVPLTPEILSVVLGKYNLIGGDLEAQEREVLSVIAHEEFRPSNYLENDLALLKLRTEVTFNNYVQPACFWYSEAYARIPGNNVIGTVVGWGFDQSDVLSSQLKQAYMPTVTESTCLKKNPLFYVNALTNKKFCAGWANGTSACNGDSGGGFVVFVPDTRSDDSANAVGAWFIRGIVSLSVKRRDIALCDPYQYVIFTDVAKYTEWIQRNLDK